MPGVARIRGFHPYQRHSCVFLIMMVKMPSSSSNNSGPHSAQYMISLFKATTCQMASRLCALKMILVRMALIVEIILAMAAMT